MNKTMAGIVTGGMRKGITGKIKIRITNGIQGDRKRAIGWGKNKCITWNLALPFVTDAIVPGFEPLPVLTPTPEECTTDWWRASCQFFDDYAYDSSPLLKKAR
ncbi:hypothetical protein HanIR_Chr13g0616971 [Helianthus annuus]|nr:hypothetical protein HanIR_Chr13g0616971 [Helianthus annuus]